MGYKDYPFVNGRPLIPIIISHPTSKVEVSAMGLIDSGADSCMFPGWIATSLGYNLKTGIINTGGVAGGGALTTWTHSVIIHIAHAEKKEIKLFSTPPCDVAFCEDDGMPLLGAQNFLYRFQNIVLLYADQKVRLTHK